ncbi:MAG: holo-ACP synthase [Oleibacter sp.]|nr:holo-ACP synthase [Thalassolituus sp.]
MFDSMPEGILGIGTDLLKVSRIEAAYKRFGERLVMRLLTPEEQLIWRQHTYPTRYLAKAFAAKEALSKSLGTGIASGVSFQNFSITRSLAGAPSVDVRGAARQRMQSLGAQHMHLSLSDEGDMIQAFAVLSK